MLFPSTPAEGDLYTSDSGTKYKFFSDVRVWKKQIVTISNNEITNYVSGSISEEGVAIYESYFNIPFVSTAIYTQSKIIPGTGDELFFSQPSAPLRSRRAPAPLANEAFISETPMISKITTNISVGAGDEINFANLNPSISKISAGGYDNDFISSSNTTNTELNAGTSPDGLSLITTDNEILLSTSSGFISEGIYSGIELSL